MNITRYAIEKNRVTIILLLLCVLAGISAYLHLPRSEDPGFILRIATVQTIFPGASPERVEELVTDKLEKEIREMPEVDYIESASFTGASFLYVWVKESYTDLRPIWDSLRRKVDTARSELPNGIIGPEVDDEFGDVFGTIVTLTGDGFSYAELKDVADEVRNELLLLDDVAKVDIVGQQQERIFVEYQSARLAEYGLSPAYLSQVLGARNIIIPGGSIKAGRERLALEPSGNFERVEDLRRSTIQIPGSRDILSLEDIVDISRGYIEPSQKKMRFNGAPALGLAISMQADGNILRLGDDVKALIERLQERYPLGIDFDFIAFQAGDVERKVDGFVENLLQAVGIVVLVMVFTLGFRTGIIVATLIPMAILLSLLLMSSFSIGLNQISLAALIIALGMLVDNAIVMSESVMVQIKEGKNAIQAAVDSARELQVPLLTSSLTTSAAFLPIYLAESMTGEYTAPLFTVVTITLLSSWVLALTMTPLLCARFLKPKPQQTADTGLYASRLYRLYRWGLVLLLKLRVLTLIVIMVIFAAAMWGLSHLPKMFFPPDDKTVFTAELSFPKGTAVETTEAMVEKLDGFIREEMLVTGERTEGIRSYAAFIGESAPKFTLTLPAQQNVPEYAMLVFNATSSERIVGDLIPRLEAWFRQNFPDLNASVGLLKLGAPIDAPVEIRLTGKDADRLFTLAEQVKQQLSTMSGTKNIRDDWGIWAKKIEVNVDQLRASQSGLTSQDVALALQAFGSGFEVSQYREDDKVIPIVMRAAAEERSQISRLEGLKLYSQSTRSAVPLSQVADIDLVWQPSNILRRDRQKTITIQADVARGTSAIAISQQIAAWLDEQNSGWDVGYRYEMGGEMEGSAQASQAIAEKMPIAAFAILMLMVLQFNSFRKSFIILITIPLGLIGVSAGLLICQSSFGFMTLLGVVSLAGIVVNNAIVLIDRIQIEQSDFGRSPQHAIVEAAQRRLRPIFLTTVTTACGMLPLWYGGGPLWESMAITIIFGLLFATGLTLGVIPVLYALLFRVSFKGYRYEDNSPQETQKRADVSSAPFTEATA